MYWDWKCCNLFASWPWKKKWGEAHFLSASDQLSKHHAEAPWTPHGHWTSDGRDKAQHLSIDHPVLRSETTHLTTPTTTDDCSSVEKLKRKPVPLSRNRRYGGAAPGQRCTVRWLWNTSHPKLHVSFSKTIRADKKDRTILVAGRYCFELQVDTTRTRTSLWDGWPKPYM